MSEQEAAALVQLPLDDLESTTNEANLHSTGEELNIDGIRRTEYDKKAGNEEKKAESFEVDCKWPGTLEEPIAFILKGFEESEKRIKQSQKKLKGRRKRFQQIMEVFMDFRPHSRSIAQFDIPAIGSTILRTRFHDHLFQSPQYQFLYDALSRRGKFAPRLCYESVRELEEFQELVDDFSLHIITIYPKALHKQLATLVRGANMYGDSEDLSSKEVTRLQGNMIKLEINGCINETLYRTYCEGFLNARESHQFVWLPYCSDY